jgi:hypothetical protein
VAFTVGDFQDLVRLLREHPEWQAELRRQILSKEGLRLPALVGQRDDPSQGVPDEHRHVEVGAGAYNQQR